MDENSNSSSISKTNSEKVFPYPDCWSDDVRMDVLFAPFRLKEVNVENYESKLKFWQNLIATYCEHRGSPCFNKRELQIAFSRKEKVPYGLDTVIEEMLVHGKIRSRTEFMYDPENSWTGWAMNSFVKKPLTWGLRKIVPYYDNEPLVVYVQLDLVKAFTKNLNESVLQKYPGNMFHYNDLKTIIQNEMRLNEEGMEICLHLLQIQKKIGIEYLEANNEKHIHLVKVPAKTDVNAQITQSDRAIHNLIKTRNNLNKQLGELEENIKLNDDKAREYLKADKRQLAKTYLRKKHLLEKNLEKRSLALHNVETLLFSVEEAQSNGEILDAYKIGSKALQTVLNESGLKYDNVDEIISDVKETIESHEEIQDILSNASLSGATENDNEIEQELREILDENVKSSTIKNPPASTSISTEANSNCSQILATTISDSDLLTMLEKLEVDSDQANLSSQSPTKQNKSLSHI